MDNGVIERDVTATRSEYLHGLRQAFPSGLTDEGKVLRVDAGTVALDIMLVEQAPRVIALLRLPRLHVTLRFMRGTPDQQAATLAHMDRTMQRGGG